MFDSTASQAIFAIRSVSLSVLTTAVLVLGGCGSGDTAKQANSLAPNSKNPSYMPTEPSAFFQEFDFHQLVDSLAPQIDWIKADLGQSNNKSNQQGPQWKKDKDWRILCNTTAGQLQILIQQLHDELATKCSLAGVKVEQKSRETELVNFEYRVGQLRGSISLRVNPPKSGSRMPGGNAPTHEVELRMTEWNYADRRVDRIGQDWRSDPVPPSIKMVAVSLRQTLRTLTS